MVIALDSNVIIAALSTGEDHSTIAQQLMRDIAAGHYQAVVSSIVYGEVITNKFDHTFRLKDFLESIMHFETIPADDAICRKAGKFRKNYGSALKLPDALHLATAVQSGAEIFVTNDHVLARLAQPVIATKTLAQL